ncbi:MAG: InlB B-repeat-containing protein [Sphaerochaetaceae bacterium]
MIKKSLFIFLTVIILIFVIHFPDAIEICKVSFESQGGEPIDSVDVAKGLKFHEPNFPTREGYFFSGSTKKKLKTKLDISGDKLAANITLSTKWISNDSRTIYMSAFASSQVGC